MRAKRNTPESRMIARNNALIQQIACLSFCAMSGRPAQVGHHLIKKSQSKYYQHDLRNIVPLTEHEHTGDSWSCAELKPDNFEGLFAARHPEQHKWWRSPDRQKYHKNPNLDELTEINRKLQAFYDRGIPYTFGDEI